MCSTVFVNCLHLSYSMISTSVVTSTHELRAPALQTDRQITLNG